jgi:hypothetical protein
MAIVCENGINIGPGIVLGGGFFPIVSGSLVFNGGNYLTVPDSTSFDQNSGAWTVETFVYPTDSTQGYVYMQNTSGFLGIVYGNDRFYVDQSSVGFPIATTPSFPTNAWYHVAMVYNGSGTVTLYVDGDSQGTWSSSGLIASAAITNIGCYVGGGDPYRGNISNLRVVKGVAVYTGNFTVPASPLTATQSSGTNISAITGSQTKLLLNTVAPNYFADSSPTPFTVTNVNSVTTSTDNPF